MAAANSNKNVNENGLPVLGEDNEWTDFSFSNSSNQKYVPVSSRPSSQASRRTPTPTKQISLTSVRRREDSFHQEDDPTQIEAIKNSMKLEAERSFTKESIDMTEFVVERSTTVSQVSKLKKSSRHNCVHNGEVEIPVQKEKKQPRQEVVEKSVVNKESRKKEETTDKTKEESSSSDDDDSDEEEEERKAPNQLLMEFLECIYAKDYPMAAKLCKMILIYEPNHAVALQFQPVIEEKIQLDLQAEQEGSGESGSDDDDDDDDDSGEEEDDSDDSNEDSDESDDSDDDDDDDDDNDENEDNQNSEDSAIGETEDSGIASTESSDKDNFYEM